MDEQAFARIGSALGDIAANAAPGPAAAGPSGNFSYSPEQMRDLVNEWTDLANDYERSHRDARGLAEVEGPGTEFASKSLANAASQSGRAFAESAQGKADYCWTQAQKLQDALDDYLGLEHHNLKRMNMGEAGPAKDGF